MPIFSSRRRRNLARKPNVLGLESRFLLSDVPVVTGQFVPPPRPPETRDPADTPLYTADLPPEGEWDNGTTGGEGSWGPGTGGVGDPDLYPPDEGPGTGPFTDEPPAPSVDNPDSWMGVTVEPGDDWYSTGDSGGGDEWMVEPPFRSPEWYTWNRYRMERERRVTTEGPVSSVPAPVSN